MSSFLTAHQHKSKVHKHHFMDWQYWNCNQWSIGWNQVVLLKVLLKNDTIASPNLQNSFQGTTNPKISEHFFIRTFSSS